MKFAFNETKVGFYGNFQGPVIYNLGFLKQTANGTECIDVLPNFFYKNEKAIMYGGAGVLLLLIIICSICCFKMGRNKPVQVAE